MSITNILIFERFPMVMNNAQKAYQYTDNLFTFFYVIRKMYWFRALPDFDEFTRFGMS